MAYENINILYNKFCRGPLQGSFCYINFDNIVKPKLSIISQTGGLIRSFDILGGLDKDMLLSFEYVGPDKLNTVINDSYLYTLEKVDDTTCVLKKFSFDNVFGNLDLFHQKIFSDYGTYSFNVNSMCVEYYNVSFIENSDKNVDSIYLNNINRLREGDILFVGPSNDPEYTGNYDVVRVEYIVRSEGRVFTTPRIKNQYIIGDTVVFSPNYYFFTNTGIAGDESRGSVIKIDNRSDAIVNRDTKKIYQRVKGAVWSTFLNSIGMLFDANIIYCNPYNYYINLRSMFLNNYLDDKKDFYTIYDIVFVDDVCFKLSSTVTYRGSDGELNTQTWYDNDKDTPIYNYQRQAMIPYVNTLSISSNDSYIRGAEAETTLNIKAIDQFGVGLRNVAVICNITEGGSQSRLNPLSGFRETDINGEATVGFISHTDDDVALITVETNEGSSYTGSVNVFSKTSIWSDVNYDGNVGFIRQISNFVFGNPWPNDLVRQVFTLNMHYFIPEMRLYGYSFFTAPGGNWVPDGNRNYFDEYLSFLGELGTSQGLSSTYEYSYSLALDDNNFNEAPTNGLSSKPDSLFIGNKLKTVNRTNVRSYICTYKNFYAYHIDPPVVPIRTDSLRWWRYIGDPWVDWFEDGFFDEGSSFYTGNIKIPEDSPLPGVSMHTKLEENSMRMSQLYHSTHNYFVDGDYSEYLMTYVNIDQFIFVQDARPVFYSHKNPVFTDVWLRLRPYASSLNPDTLVMKIRKVSRFEDTGVIDITNEIFIESFDAGGSIEGLEVTYTPIEWFDYNSVVYVYIEVYDHTNNMIKINYWFTLIHDYRLPYLTNLSPNRLDYNVDPITSIYFEIKDNETGIDINSLIVTVNSKVVFPQVEKINNHHYIVEFTPEIPFMYNTSVDIGVVVSDRAFQKNILRDGYIFYIKESSSVNLIGYEPKPCIGGVSRYHDVSFLALDAGDGVDKNKLRLQVAEVDVTKHSNITIVPIIYRVL